MQDTKSSNKEQEKLTLSQFDYKLPEELIANYPKPRGESRLMILRGDNNLEHSNISELPNFLAKGDLLVFNDTKVIPARIKAEKLTGGKLEIMLERLLEDNKILTLVKGGKSLREGQEVSLPNGCKAKFVERQGDMFILQFQAQKPALDILQEIGEIPLPPYITREAQEIDKETYQTIYAKNYGAVAAPTAGLHFSQELMDQLKAKGVEFGFVTLHVGAGTFQPIRSEDILQHKMHSEWIEVSAELSRRVAKTKATGGRVIAVGTTSVRSLETASSDGEVREYKGFSDIFIYPGYKWQAVDGIVTNFHLPKSSLLLLVSAFKSKEEIFKAYKEAIALEYRFFSYGDAMLLL